jgi:hypothetical protein
MPLKDTVFAYDIHTVQMITVLIIAMRPYIRLLCGVAKKLSHSYERDSKMVSG